jgi:hypothetical protein
MLVEWRQLHSLLTSALDAGVWTASRSGHFTVGKVHTLEAGMFWRREKFLGLSGIRTQIIQPVA